MNYLLIRHRVADFSHGKAAYDDHSGAREQAGLKEKELLHDIKDTNQVVLLFEIADIQRAQNFAESSDLREVMRAAGVTYKPDIYLPRQ
jgi:hypothetical protein